MFVKPTLFAQLKCSRIRMLHTVRAPAPPTSCLEPVIDCRFDKTGFSEVVSHDFRLARHSVGKLLHHCARNLTVQLLPPALEQALIGRVPHERVLEAIDSFRLLATVGYELGLL